MSNIAAMDKWRKPVTILIHIKHAARAHLAFKKSTSGCARATLG
jgi:hypothetical protein